MHFLNESDVLDAPEGRRVFVMESGGRVLGFVVLAPIPARNGWLTELFVRGENAPNGAIELGLHHAVQAVADDGAELLTMGMVPLSTHASQAENPEWLRGLAGWARAHGRRFYNFDGLEAFKGSSSRTRGSRFLPFRMRRGLAFAHCLRWSGRLRGCIRFGRWRLALEGRLRRRRSGSFADVSLLGT